MAVAATEGVGDTLAVTVTVGDEEAITDEDAVKVAVTDFVAETVGVRLGETDPDGVGDGEGGQFSCETGLRPADKGTSERPRMDCPKEEAFITVEVSTPGSTRKMSEGLAAYMTKKPDSQRPVNAKKGSLPELRGMLRCRDQNEPEYAYLYNAGETLRLPSVTHTVLSFSKTNCQGSNVPMAPASGMPARGMTSESVIALFTKAPSTWKIPYPPAAYPEKYKTPLRITVDRTSNDRREVIVGEFRLRRPSAPPMANLSEPVASRTETERCFHALLALTANDRVNDTASNALNSATTTSPAV
jgi:hypothetical protein